MNALSSNPTMAMLVVHAEPPSPAPSSERNPIAQAGADHGHDRTGRRGQRVRLDQVVFVDDVRQ